MDWESAVLRQLGPLTRLTDLASEMNEQPFVFASFA